MLGEIASILTSVKAATDIAKLLQQSNLSLEKAETKLKLAELISALADTKIQVADIRELLLQKDEEIRRMQDELKLQGDIIYDKPYYWVKAAEGKDGPFCQLCYDEGQKLIRLQSNIQGFWRCASCDNTFKDSSYSPQSEAIRTASRGGWVRGY